MTNDLDVWSDRTLVATVSQRRGAMRTTYTSLSVPMLSVAMPVRTSAYPERISRPFFHGLLPEGDARRVIAYDLGLGNQGGEDVALLGAIGRDCAGALVIVPSGEEPPRPGPGALQPLTEEEVAQRIRALPDHPLGVDDRVRLSLPGVQNKLLLARSPSGRWHVPQDGAPSTHILKPEIRRLPGSVDNEVFCQTVAAHAGLDTAETAVLEIGDERVLVSTRFDRAFDADAVHRLHQEDACQALSVLTVHPDRKYQTDPDGQPSFRGIAGVLDRWAERGAREALFDSMAVNVILGNADLHGKNISLLHRDGEVSLAPAYDIMSTTALGEGLTTALGMYVGNARSLVAVGADDLISEGTSWGLRTAHIEKRLGDLIERLTGAVETAAETYPHVSGRLVDHIRSRVAAMADDHATRTGPTIKVPPPMPPSSAGPSNVRAYRRGDGTPVPGHPRKRPRRH